jgi:hypothetical protein
MAIDITNLVVSIADSSVVGVNDLVAAIDALGDLYEWGIDAGVTTFATFEAEIQASHPHLDGDKLNKVMGVILPALQSWLETQTVDDVNSDYDGATYVEMLNKVRNI